MARLVLVLAVLGGVAMSVWYLTIGPKWALGLALGLFFAALVALLVSNLRSLSR
jgi:hypothetical protein